VRNEKGFWGVGGGPQQSPVPLQKRARGTSPPTSSPAHTIITISSEALGIFPSTIKEAQEALSLFFSATLLLFVLLCLLFSKKKGRYSNQACKSVERTQLRRERCIGFTTPCVGGKRGIHRWSVHRPKHVFSFYCWLVSRCVCVCA
jgi:hypothetical protein